MSTYTKLFNSILASTIWREPDHVRIVWITMLAMTDRNGLVEASIPGLADLARVPVEKCREAIEILMAPDIDSRTPDNEGRRIEKVNGGFVILNHAKYRDAMSADDRREYHRTYWHKRKGKYQDSTPTQQNSTHSTITQTTSTDSIHTDTDTDTDTDSVQRERERERAPDVAGGCPEIPPMSRKDFDTLADMRAVPKDCAEWFWNTHDARGWLDARGQPIRKVEPLLLNALRAWRSNQGPVGSAQQATVKIPSATDTILRQKEFERVVAAMRSIRDSYSDHQAWDAKDKRRYNQLVERKKELQKILGVTV